MKRMLRPQAVTLPDDALVPKENLVSPPPDKFTHKLRHAQPYFFDRARDAKPRGELAAGTPVVLLSHGSGAWCRVVDGRGLRVETAFDGLTAIKST